MVAKPKIGAWAWAMDVDAVIRLLKPFKGNLSAILYNKNYSAAANPNYTWYAFINSTSDATKLVQTVNAGAKIQAAIIKDERNISGLSGTYMTPDQYTTDYMKIYDILHTAGIPTSTMGLAGMPGSVWETAIMHNIKFDDKYFNGIKSLPSDFWAFNPSGNRRKEIYRILSTYTTKPWIFSPHPFRPNWWPLDRNTILAYIAENWIYHENTEFWLEVAKKPNVESILIWDLKEGPLTWKGKQAWQSWHGLYDRNENMTIIGKKVLEGVM